jgi:two-component system, NarL family, sensor histidine kinase DegS
VSSEPGPGYTELNDAYYGLEGELKHVQADIEEVAMMIRQSQGETQTLTRRDTQMSNRLRQIETNLESYSREEIREIYDSVRESQMRLFLMRGQIEQLEHRRRTLEAYTKQIQQMMALTQSLAARPAPAATPPVGEPVSQTAQQTIVRIIDAQEKERRALARQMHDGPATSLSNLVLQAEVVERLFSLDLEQARNELGVLKVAVNSTFQRTRDFIFNLRPMILDDLGLFPTLRRYVQEFQNKTKIATELTIMGRDRRMPVHIEVIIFRAIQELLNNTLQHANASRVQINIDVGDAVVSAVVEDDGSGFDVQRTLSQAGANKKIGISGIIERTELLGGDIQFDSVLGRGTRVSLRLPTSE